MDIENNSNNINIDNHKMQKPKKSRGFKIFIAIFLILCILAFSTLAAGVIYLKKNINFRYNEITSKPKELGFEEIKNDEIVNIALFGIDTTNPNSFKGRSDSIMILSLNKTTDKIKLISVLRDSFVPIERKGWTDFSKINSAYSKGGPELAIKTLNEVFDLDISEYATVNFYGMADIIDTMGGVDVTVTEAEVDYINYGVTEQCKKKGLDPEDYKVKRSGTQRLYGIQAVSYSRIRYVSNAEGTANDYGRTDRQRYVLTQLFKSVKSKSKAEYFTLIKSLSPYCETSLTEWEILKLAVEVLIGNPVLEETRMPSPEYIMSPPKVDAGAITYYDLNFAANLIHAFIYENVTPETFIQLSGIEKNDWYSAGYQKPEIISYKQRKAEAENSQNKTSAEQTASAGNKQE